LPVPPAGHVVVTSRQVDGWEKLGQTTVVSPWSRDESISYLLARTGDPAPERAAALAEALGDLPLALSMAASYMDESGSGMELYLEQLQAAAPQLLDVDTKSSTAATVDATLGPVWEELSKEPLALELLNLAAFYAPERIPRSLLTEFLVLPESARTEGDLPVDDRAIAASVRFAQLFEQDGGFMFHPMLAQRIRARLGEQAAVWAAQACRVVLSALSKERQIATDLLPHALAATAHAMYLAPLAEPAGESYATIARLRVLSAQLLVQLGQSEEAAQALTEVAEFLANARPDSGELDPILAVAVTVERSRVAAHLEETAQAQAFRHQALALARSRDVRPATAPTLSCQMLLDVLPADPTGEDADGWYGALSFRALEVGHQVLTAHPATAEDATAAALELRLRVVGHLIAAEQFDDAAATGMRLLYEALATMTPNATAVAVATGKLTAIALDALGDGTAAQALRRQILQATK
jgi:hypothetical protein